MNNIISNLIYSLRHPELDSGSHPKIQKLDEMLKQVQHDKQPFSTSTLMKILSFIFFSLLLISCGNNSAETTNH